MTWAVRVLEVRGKSFRLPTRQRYSHLQDVQANVAILIDVRMEAAGRVESHRRCLVRISRREFERQLKSEALVDLVMGKALQCHSDDAWRSESLGRAWRERTVPAPPVMVPVH
eukprot:scaffold72348_cov29-Tisochrysis_lutea.AAC.3